MGLKSNQKYTYVSYIPCAYSLEVTLCFQCTCILILTCHMRSGVEISTCDVMSILKMFQILDFQIRHAQPILLSSMMCFACLPWKPPCFALTLTEVNLVGKDGTQLLNSTLCVNVYCVKKSELKTLSSEFKCSYNDSLKIRKTYPESILI